MLAGMLVLLYREKGSDLLLGGVSLEYDPTAGPTKFMVGCEQGEGSAISSYSCLCVPACPCNPFSLATVIPAVSFSLLLLPCCCRLRAELQPQGQESSRQGGQQLHRTPWACVQLAQVSKAAAAVLAKHACHGLQWQRRCIAIANCSVAGHTTVRRAWQPRPYKVAVCLC